MSRPQSPVPTLPPARLAVVIDEQATRAAHAAGDDAWWLYATEVLGHAGLDHRRLGSVPAQLNDLDVMIIASPQRVAAESVRALDGWLSAGGTLIITAIVPELDALAGVAVGPDRVEDTVTLADDPSWTTRPELPLRGIGGRVLEPADGAEALAGWSDGTAAVVRQRHGDGTVISYGVDLWRTIVTIQQGYPVAGDGKPAPDGTAPIDDGILKCEDGMALDYADRVLPPGEPEIAADFTHSYPPPSAVPLFSTAQADQWWITLLQQIWAGHDHRQQASAWLHYWPAGVPAVAHMSHDADGNVEEDGLAALDAFAEAEVSVTWCQVFPGGYSPELYAKIGEAGHEQALHYNAMGDADLATWGWPQFRAQHAWAQAVTGTDAIVSNKNHYTRWEGWTEFYTWCERVGVKIDESRGPSKQGTVGFPFGTAHLSFPIGDVSVHNRPMDVLNLPLHTQDLAWAGHIACRDVILDGAEAVHGVAHFLFHGPHLRGKPATREACPEVARLARERGMEWWTAGQLSDWERARRGVRVTITEESDGWLVSVDADQPISRAGLVLQLPGVAQAPTAADGSAGVTEVTRHGRRFHELAVDLPAGRSSWRINR